MNGNHRRALTLIVKDNPLKSCYIYTIYIFLCKRKTNFYDNPYNIMYIFCILLFLYPQNSNKNREKITEKVFLTIM